MSNCASLVWTVKPVVSLPELYFPGNVYSTSVLQKLGVSTTPNTQDVYHNIINISNTGLANFQLFTKYDSVYTDQQNIHKVDFVKIIIDNLQYLHHRSAQSTEVDLLKTLEKVSCIPVSAEGMTEVMTTSRSYTMLSIAKPVLVNSLQVVAERIDEELAPYINSLPRCLNIIDGALQRIGVCQTIDLRHIQYMLETIYKQFTDQMLTPNDARLVRNCVLKLADLLDYTDQEKASKQLQILYLPSITKNKMFPSTNLLFIDSDRYKRHARFLNFADTKYSIFQIPRDRLGVTNHHQKREEVLNV